MPAYERGHSGQEIGEMQQRLADLGYEINVTNEFDEYTEETLRRYQVDWLYAEGTGVADEGTLNQLEYHHSTRPAGEIGGPQFGEEPIYGAGASSESHWWDGNQWIPFENPKPTWGYGHTTDEQTGEEHYFVGGLDINDSGTGTKETILGAHLNVSEAGYQADAAIIKWDAQTPSGFGLQGGAFTAQAEEVFGNEGYYGVGAQANVVEGGVSYGGSQGDKNSTDDVFIKGSASYGAGGGARVYAGTDVDHDHVNEYGFGADYQFLGGDIRVESETLTAVENAATEAYNEVKQEAGELFDEVVEGASKIISGEEPLPDVRN